MNYLNIAKWLGILFLLAALVKRILENSADDAAAKLREGIRTAYDFPPDLKITHTDDIDAHGYVATVLDALLRICLFFVNPFTSSPGRVRTNAEFLFRLFLSEREYDALVGDLDQRYWQTRNNRGALRANFWYWTQALSSVLPIVWAWVKKIVMKPIVAIITWAAARGLLKDGSWLVAVAEVWKRIRL